MSAFFWVFIDFTSLLRVKIERKKPHIIVKPIHSPLESKMESYVY